MAGISKGQNCRKRRERDFQPGQVREGQGTSLRAGQRAVSCDFSQVIKKSISRQRKGQKVEEVKPEAH